MAASRLADALTNIKGAELLKAYLNQRGSLLDDDLDMDKSFVDVASASDVPATLLLGFFQFLAQQTASSSANKLDEACDAAVALAHQIYAEPQATQVAASSFAAKPHLRRACVVAEELAQLAAGNATKHGKGDANSLSGVFVLQAGSQADQAQQPILQLVPDASAPPSTSFSLPGDHQAHSTYKVGGNRAFFPASLS